MLTGSVVISSVFFEQKIHLGGSSGDPVYRNTITPTRFPQPPAFGTQFVKSVSIQSAVVSADFNMKNLPTGVFVEWDTTTNYGSATGAFPLDFDFFVRRDITVSNLAPGTVHYLRVVATNSAGATYGNDLTLATLAPATVITLPADNRKTTSAVLNASVTVNGLATAAYFEWGATTNYDRSTALQNLGSPSLVTNISALLTGLTPQTTYHGRAVAFAAGITNLGGDVLFTTTPPPTNLVVTNLVTDDVRGAIKRGGSVTFACDGVVVLSNEMQIANDVSIDASGHAITFSGSNVTRIFTVQPGVLFAITNLTLANGRSTNGGAIYNEGTLVAQDCRFLSNAVVGVNGVRGTNGLDGTNSTSFPAVTPGTPGGPGGNAQNVAGGAILNSGALNLWKCLFLGNQAMAGTGGQGGIGGAGGNQLPCCRGQARDGGTGGVGGVGGSAIGGSIANFGILSLNLCTFSNSLLVGGTGGQGGTGGFPGQAFSLTTSYGGTGGLGGPALGGAIFTIGNSFISNSLFVANSGFGGDGGDGGAAAANHFYTFPGGGTNGTTANGGGIYNGNDCIIANCSFAMNAVTGGTGGLWWYAVPFSNGGDGFGGGLASTGNCQAVNLTLVGPVTSLATMERMGIVSAGPSPTPAAFFKS
jgi:hypothetical protein